MSESLQPLFSEDYVRQSDEGPTKPKRNNTLKKLVVLGLAGIGLACVFFQKSSHKTNDEPVSLIGSTSIIDGHDNEVVIY
jgi:hypothetical protein